MTVTLDNLGWDSRFEEAFRQLAQPGWYPARIIRETKINYTVIGQGTGDHDAVLSGKVWNDADSDADLPAVVTAWEPARYFQTFQNADVWTPDGWLVTASFSGGEVQLRKGDKVCNATLPPGMLLRYKPNKSTAEWVDFMASIEERARVYERMAQGASDDMAPIHLEKARQIRAEYGMGVPA